MAHPDFNMIPNQEMAAACNEIFVPDQYRFVSELEYAQRYGQANFPQAPATIVSIAAAYMETRGRGVGVRRQYVEMRPDLADRDQIAEMYTKSVGSFQDLSGKMLTAMETVPEIRGDLDELQDRCMQVTLGAGKRLLTAHMTARVEADGRIIDGLAYPRSVSDYLGLLVREVAIDNLAIIDKVIEMGFASPGDMEEVQEVRAFAKPILRGDAVLQTCGAIAVSTFLPEAPNMRAMLTQSNPTQPPLQPGPTTPGLSRAERRRIEREQRKGKR